MDSDGDDRSVSLSDHKFITELRRVRNNDPLFKHLFWYNYNIIQNLTIEEWEDIGRDLSNNTYLEWLAIIGGVLNDEKLSSLFRGLTRSSSITRLDLSNNEISAAGLMSLEPFLKNSTNLRTLDVSYNDIQTEGFNILMQVLRDSPVESLHCSHCGIASIEIENAPHNLQELILDDNDIQSEGFNRLLRSLRDSNVAGLYCSSCHIESIEIVTNSFPKKLKELNLASNRINSNGCHEIAKLLQEGSITLEMLCLDSNLIGDEDVKILVEALKTNTSLTHLDLENNDGISRNGRLLILKMLNDISGIKSTLQSNHTLQVIFLESTHGDIHRYINNALSCNRRYSVRAGREKVIETQLHSRRRAELTQIQEIQRQSEYGEIDPLHLPEVLSLVGRRHGQEELYLALKVSIAEVITDHCG